MALLNDAVISNLDTHNIAGHTVHLKFLLSSCLYIRPSVWHQGYKQRGYANF
jgi:hypothetical protein